MRNSIRMLVETAELLKLEDNLKFELNNNLTQILTALNRNERLEEFLDLINLSHLIQSNSYKPHKNGIIIVVGGSEIKKQDFYGIFKKLNISKDRLELNLEYKDAVTFDFNKTQFNPKYSLILVGPMPHSGTSKGDYGSVISRIEQEEGYPPVMRLTDKNNSLKISKNSIKEAIEEAIKKGFIVGDEIF